MWTLLGWMLVGAVVIVGFALLVGKWFAVGMGRQALTPPAGHLSVTSDGTLHGTRVHDSKGRRVLGVAGVCFNAEPNRPVTCAVDILSRNFFGIGRAEFHVANPVTGSMRPVQRVVWADGSEWAAEEAGQQ